MADEYWMFQEQLHRFPIHPPTLFFTGTHTLTDMSDKRETNRFSFAGIFSFCVCFLDQKE
jgi:hypothetical protein